MPRSQFTVEQTLRAQANSCINIGSPLYGTLLKGLLRDYRAGGVTKSMLDGVTDRPLHDALALRYVGTGHLIALQGNAPDLARHYPSCGGAWDGGKQVVDDFLATVTANEAEFRRGVRRNVRTNEVGRAVVLASGFSLISRRHRLPLDLLEIGSSAGLLSLWNHFSYDTGETTLGDVNSPVRFGPEWWLPPPPPLDHDVIIRNRRGCDIAPIDVRMPDDRMRLLSFLWPDQEARIRRLQAAVDIASRVPVRVDPMDAGDWLSLRLDDGPAEGAATVVFHSIVWQYLSSATKDHLRSVLAEAGARATAESPMCWLRMEPVDSAHADLRLTSWPGGDEEVLAEVGYHGNNVVWLHRD